MLVLEIYQFDSILDAKYLVKAYIEPASFTLIITVLYHQYRYTSSNNVIRNKLR